MNALDILKYGHLTVLRAIDKLPEPDWHTGGVCGVWSVKDIIGHLAVYELILEEVMTGFLNQGDVAQPNLNKMTAQGNAFNDNEAALRKDYTVEQASREYMDAYARVAALAPEIGPEKYREAGTLPWYGMEYALDDYIVYAFYGHKREHCAQIDAYRDRLRRTG